MSAESQPAWLVDEFDAALRRLSSPPDERVVCLDRLGVEVDELAPEVGDVAGAVLAAVRRGGPPEGLAERVGALDRQLRAMGGADRSASWLEGVWLGKAKEMVDASTTWAGQRESGEAPAPSERPPAPFGRPPAPAPFGRPPGSGGARAVGGAHRTTLTWGVAT